MKRNRNTTCMVSDVTVENFKQITRTDLLLTSITIRLSHPNQTNFQVKAFEKFPRGNVYSWLKMYTKELLFFNKFYPPTTGQKVFFVI